VKDNFLLFNGEVRRDNTGHLFPLPNEPLSFASLMLRLVIQRSGIGDDSHLCTPRLPGRRHSRRHILSQFNLAQIQIGNSS
jgi:hypothetical protein